MRKRTTLSIDSETQYVANRIAQLLEDEASERTGVPVGITGASVLRTILRDGLVRLAAEHGVAHALGAEQGVTRG